MKEKIINSYISKLTREDVISFAIKNNIQLSDEEIDILLNTIKSDWKKILNNPEEALQNIKNKVSENTYKNIIYLYNLYSDKLSLL